MKSDLDVNRRLKRNIRPDGLDKKNSEIREECQLALDILRRGKDHQAHSHKFPAGSDCVENFSDLTRIYLSILGISETAATTMLQICADDWIFQFDDIGNAGYFLDTDEHIIWIDNFGMDAPSLAQSDYFFNVLMMNILRGMRDAWQDARWANATKIYHPEALLMLEKIRAADSDIMALYFADELAVKGHDSSIRHLSASEDAALARDFASREHNRNVRAASAFRGWFTDTKRVDACDHETLCYLDTILGDVERGNPFGRGRLTPIEIVRMGCLPDGSSYLAGYGEAVLRDPIFSGLTDPINQAHYYHLVRDMESYNVNGVPFRSPKLAARIFPEETVIQE